MSVSKDKKEALVTFVQVLNHPNFKTRFIKLHGLDPDKKYTVSFPDENQAYFPEITLSGSTIMNAGIGIKRDWGDFQAKLIHIYS